MSRNATPLSHLPIEQQNEPDDLNKLLYTLYTTPLTDHIGLASISAATTSDPILQQLTTGQNWIPESAPKELERFGPGNNSNRKWHLMQRRLSYTTRITPTASNTIMPPRQPPRIKFNATSSPFAFFLLWHEL